MIKILLLVGGVWFFLALLFVGALFTAYTKSLPGKGSKSLAKRQAHTSKPPRSTIPRRRAVHQETEWEIQKPVEA